MELNNIKVQLGTDKEKLKSICAKEARIPLAKVRTFRILKQSLDARHKGDIKQVYSVLISEKDEPIVEYNIPKAKRDYRPVVVGFGPAGIFAAHTLARAGLCPIVLERGEEIDSRTVSVNKLRKEGILSTESNAQFGEGGAGAFSDGKLNTGIKDKLICGDVLAAFVRCGADESLLYAAKPHVGTDVLVNVVKTLRKEIEALGGDIFFGAKVTDISPIGKGVYDLTYTGGNVRTDAVVLAIGHSARDTYDMLISRGYMMELKPFAVGVRAEHLQRSINKAMFGLENGQYLPAADYKLAEHTALGGVYTFCMCPGGEVICGASEEGGLAVNGMSYHARNGKNANAALLVGVDVSDFDGSDIKAGIRYQRKLERKAFELGGGGYVAPAQRVGDFMKGQTTSSFGEVAPSYAPGVKGSDLNQLLPERICGALKLGITAFGRKIQGYDASDAVLTGVETRSSAPLRVIRDENMQSVNNAGIYPCGEGCGYAGGIMSAAVDGIKVALRIIGTSEEVVYKKQN